LANSQPASQPLYFDCGDSLLNLAMSGPYPDDSQDTQVEKNEVARDLAMERLQEIADARELVIARERRKIEQDQSELAVMVEALNVAKLDCAHAPIYFQSEALLFADDDIVTSTLVNVVQGVSTFYIGGTADVLGRWLGRFCRGSIVFLSLRRQGLSRQSIPKAASRKRIVGIPGELQGNQI
jgi:hypothetical protein